MLSISLSAPAWRSLQYQSNRNLSIVIACRPGATPSDQRLLSPVQATIAARSLPIISLLWAIPRRRRCRCHMLYALFALPSSLGGLPLPHSTNDNKRVGCNSGKVTSFAEQSDGSISGPEGGCISSAAFST